MDDRLRELERSLNLEVPPTQPPARKRGPRGVGFVGGAGIAVVVTLTLLIGLQLGALPWRFRRQIWQLQGALAGGLVGYVVGWAACSRSRTSDEDE